MISPLWESLLWRACTAGHQTHQAAVDWVCGGNCPGYTSTGKVQYNACLKLPTEFTLKCKYIICSCISIHHVNVYHLEAQVQVVDDFVEVLCLCFQNWLHNEGVEILPRFVLSFGSKYYTVFFWLTGAPLNFLSTNSFIISGRGANLPGNLAVWGERL